jgi:hypothetical protein
MIKVLKFQEILVKKYWNDFFSKLDNLEKIKEMKTDETKTDKEISEYIMKLTADWVLNMSEYTEFIYTNFENLIDLFIKKIEFKDWKEIIEKEEVKDYIFQEANDEEFTTITNILWNCFKDMNKEQSESKKKG